MITKAQASGYLARGEHDHTVTYFDLYGTIFALHTKIEELQQAVDRYVPVDPDQRHELIDKWGM